MKTIIRLLLLQICLKFNATAGDLDTMGVTQTRATNAALTGGGVTVGQPEAQGGANDWEVYPPYAGQVLGIFTWFNTNGSSTNFPNSLGTDSSHADQVGSHYYGMTSGVAPGVAHVDSYEAVYFYEIDVVGQMPISDAVVNQSFIFTGSDPPQTTVDSTYDNYADLYGTLFCSAVGNGGAVSAPGTTYNGLGVGCYGIGANSSTGPTPDNGRSKPDLVAPGTETSFSTPYVAGAAAVLFQAAALGDGGANTSAAGDLRTVKALLLNGAIKPGDWTHTTNAPLDTRYGAGVLNLNYSYQQLSAGRQTVSFSGTVSAGGSHLPGTPSNVIHSLLGWDYQSEMSSVLQDAVNHYYIDNSGNSATSLTLTATLAWNRQTGQSGVNDLALFLYNTTNAVLITNSVSTVDNIQHIYISSLPRGKYDLQVVKYGGLSASETYALAFQFYPISPPSLNITSVGGNTVVSWPSSPTIFNLQQTTNLSPPILWSAVGTIGLITNTTVSVTLSPGAATAFYRLVR